MGSFPARMAQLESDVGDGDMVMGGIVGQPYAAKQHNTAYYRHPRGGITRFLEIPFMSQHEDMLQTLADSVITERGSHIRPAAIQVARQFDEIVRTYAPVEFTTLRNSTSVYVEDAGRPIFAANQRDARNVEKQ